MGKVCRTSAVLEPCSITALLLFPARHNGPYNQEKESQCA
jgi:hypothetical protein